MSDLTGDLRSALHAAHEISDRLCRHDLASAELAPILAWQHATFDAFSSSGAIEDLEAAMSEIASRDPRSELAVEILRSEVSAVTQHLSGIWDRWRHTDKSGVDKKEHQRTRTALKAPTRRAMRILKTLLQSLAEILGDLFPGLKALLEVVKEAADHFSQ